MVDVVARTGAGIVLMHMYGTPRTMQQAPRYDDVVGEISDIFRGANPFRDGTWHCTKTNHS